MALEALTSAAPVRGREYLVVSPAESIEQFDDEASIQALTDALTNKSIFVVTVHLDYSNTQGGKRDADITLRFDGIDQNGKEYTIAELSKDTLKKSFNADLIEYTSPITGLDDWNRTINEIGRYGVKLQDVPVRFQYTDEEPEPRYAIHRPVTHIDPSAVRSKTIGRQLERMMQYEHSPIIIDVPEKPDATEFIVQYGDGHSTLLNKFAIANAFGIKNEKISRTDAAWLSRKLSHCRYNGHIRTVLVRQNGEILNPYIVADHRTDPTDELVDAWFAIKNAERQKQQQIDEAHKQDAIQQLNSVYESGAQSTEQLAITQDEIDGEVDWHYMNPESVDPELEENTYDRSYRTYVRKIKSYQHTGVWDDEADKHSPIAIKRWEKRNIVPGKWRNTYETKPIHRGKKDMKKDVKSGTAPLLRKHKQAFSVGSHISLMNGNNERPRRRELNDPTFIKRQQINPWHRRDLGSKLLHKVESRVTEEKIKDRNNSRAQFIRERQEGAIQPTQYSRLEHTTENQLATWLRSGDAPKWFLQASREERIEYNRKFFESEKMPVDRIDWRITFNKNHVRSEGQYRHALFNGSSRQSGRR